MISLKCKARYTIFLRNKFKFQQRSVEYIVKITGRKTRMTSEDNKITSTRTYLGDLSLRSTMDGTYYSSRPSLIRNKQQIQIYDRGILNPNWQPVDSIAVSAASFPFIAT